jgi:hypothetical protein
MLSLRKIDSFCKAWLLVGEYERGAMKTSVQPLLGTSPANFDPVYAGQIHRSAV